MRLRCNKIEAVGQKRWMLVVSLLTVVLLGASVAHAQATDVVVLRNGRQISGNLGSVDARWVNIGSRKVPRAQVNYIHFAGAKASAPLGVPGHDIVTYRNGRRFRGYVSGINANMVRRNLVQIPRSQIAIVQFGKYR